MEGTRFIDKKHRLASIEVYDWENNNEFSAEFFEVGGLPYDHEYNAYEVDDIDYLFGRAADWQWGMGDFADDENAAPERRGVFITWYTYIINADGYLVGDFLREVDAINWAYAHGDDIDTPTIIGEDGNMVDNW